MIPSLATLKSYKMKIWIFNFITGCD